MGYYFLLILLISVPRVFHFTQEARESISELDIQKKKTTKEHKLSHWFPPSFKKSSNKNIKVFDAITIFNMDKDINNIFLKTKDMQEEFRKELKLLNIQIDYCTQQLKKTLEAQYSGEEHSTEIVEIYTKIFELSDIKNKKLNTHAMELMKEFKDMSKKNHDNIKKNIKLAQKDPTELVTKLLKRYEAYRQ